jgi:hypothetical protein
MGWVRSMHGDKMCVELKPYLCNNGYRSWVYCLTTITMVRDVTT